MGFYDYRCPLTGLSLLGQRCDLLLFRRASGRVEPLWGTVTGTYNRLGTIDDEPVHARDVELLDAAWSALAAAGRLVHDGDDPGPDEPFFERFEPHRHVITLDGDKVDLTLFHHRVLEYLVEELELPDDVDALFCRALPSGTPFAGAAPHDLAPGLRRLAALRVHLGNRPIPTLGTAAQHGPDDAIRTIRDARKRAPDLRAAIDRAEAEDYRKWTAAPGRR